MLRATFKSLMSRKARLFLSAIAIILGVMFIAGSLVLRSSFGASIESMFTTAFESVDVQVTSAKTNETTQQPEAIPESVLAQLAGVKGVEGTPKGLVTDGAGVVQVVDKNGKVAPGFGAPTIAANWVGADDPIEMREGSGPVSDDQVALSANLAEANGLKVGDKFTVISLLDSSGKQTFTVSGVFGFTGGRDTLGGEKTMYFTTPVAQRLVLDKTGVFTSIDVKAAPGTTDEQLRDNVKAALGGDYKVQTGEELAKSVSDQFGTVLDAFNYVLIAFGSIAVLVSIFLIINTFSIIVAQRTRELALFRAMGAARGQVLGSVLLEALFIGVIAGVFGLGLGILAGWGGTAVLGNLFGGQLTAELSVPVGAVIASLVIGIGVTILAALFPAIRASRIPPIAALRDAANAIRPVWPFAVAGGLFLVPGAALVIWQLSIKEATLGVFATGIGLLFIGAILATPLIARPFVSLIGRLMSWSIPGKLGRLNSGRNPRRTSITAVALMIGVTLITAIGVLAASVQASFDKFLETSLKADVLIAGTAPSQVPPTFDEKILGEAKQVQGVDKVAGVWFDGAAKLNGKDVFVQATDDLPAMTYMLGQKMHEGSGSLGSGTDLVVNQAVAKEYGLSLGGSATITFSGDPAPRTFTVSGIIASGDSDDPAIYVSSADAQYFPLKSPVQAFIAFGDGADKKAVTDKLNDLLADNPLVTVADVSAIGDQMKSIIDIMLTVIQVLLLLAMFIAVIGVINTLTLSVLERTRELGMLRAVGFSRSQVSGMVTVESVVISLFGALLGIGVGVGLGVLGQRALKNDFVTELALPWGTIAGYLIAAIVIGVLAALIPAYRANRLNVLKAISYE
ncbi:membrane protein [Actinorhabdospora filicis]|uniref:Membrane protein n=1 Tax=Actinorhabdospora filicis TaxID=1785913 RepID=A0A9W6W4C6_9ACTN|nr:FtsX-like permease family protein [Actinorhabdospora filicis]GLZ79117.1 membrane protein [Actinorhabdospora filicis]